MRAGMATMLFNLESLTPEPLMDLLAPVKAVGWVTGVFGAGRILNRKTATSRLKRRAI